jgi:hypothetical protein
MLLRFQKAAGRGNCETENQAFSMRLRFLNIRELSAGCHFTESATTRPSDFPEADLWPASIRCREHANLRPKPNRLLIRDYVRDGDLSLVTA